MDSLVNLVNGLTYNSTHTTTSTSESGWIPYSTMNRNVILPQTGKFIQVDCDFISLLRMMDNSCYCYMIEDYPDVKINESRIMSIEVDYSDKAIIIILEHDSFREVDRDEIPTQSIFIRSIHDKTNCPFCGSEVEINHIIQTALEKMKHKHQE